MPQPNCDLDEHWTLKQEGKESVLQVLTLGHTLNCKYKHRCSASPSASGIIQIDPSSRSADLPPFHPRAYESEQERHTTVDATP